MSVISEIVFGRSHEQKVVDVTAMLHEALSGAPSKAGIHINVTQALRISAVFGCVRVLAEDIAKLPFRLYREAPSGKKQVASNHPLHWILYRKPNSWMTSFELRESMMLHATLGKGAHAFINSGSSGILELIPLVPSSVTIRQLPGTREVVFDVRDPDGLIGTFPRSKILHVRGPSWNTIEGIALTSAAREVMGLAVAIEESQERLYLNGGRPGGYITTDSTLGEPARLRLKALSENGIAGILNTGKIPVFDQGLKFISSAMTSVDAQTLESRKLQVIEVCRMFRVNPQKVMHLEQSTSYSSAEQHNISHATDTIHPWVERWEQAVSRDCLTDEEVRSGLTPKLGMQALMRGDNASRAIYYKASLGTASSPGWNSPNDIRRLEDQDPIDDPEADEIVTVSKMSGKQAPADPAAGDGAGGLTNDPGNAKGAP